MNHANNNEIYVRGVKSTLEIDATHGNMIHMICF